MAKMIKWPYIEQYRNVVRNVTQRARYKGKDENGEAVFDPFVKLPKLKFEGTVKLHGTNAAVGVGDGEVWFQSRENIITPEKDNVGFAMFAYGHQDVWNDMASAALSIEPTMERKDVLIFGEWCGGNIQANVVITGLPKMFVIFGIALVDAEGNKSYLTRTEVEAVIKKCDYGIAKPSARKDTPAVYCIYDFPTFGCSIDFEQPHEMQNFLNERTMEVEEECPVGKAFGVSGIGEGIVWRCIEEGWEDSGYWFKVKGVKHSNSKVKTLATVDVERINNIQALAERLADTGRLEQGIQAVFDTLNGGEVDIKRTGDFIKWVMADVFKEELDTISASGFTGKDLNGPVSKIARDYLMKQLDV